MRKLKLSVRRKTLNQIYVLFLRPILEYSSVVWDNCTQYEKDRLEKVQIEAARIVTGTTRYITLNNLYKEIGWLTLEDRRKYQKLVLTFKIRNNMVPDYLSTLFPRQVRESVQYNLSNQNDFVIPTRRTTLCERSFVPSAIQQWNSLPLIVRNIQSLSLFKCEFLRTMFPTRVVPPHFMHGNRLLSILHTRLRNNCSDLKHELFINHVSDHDLCFYCNVIENVDHYFFHCNRYRNERLQLFRETRHLHPLNCKLLLYGSNTFTHEDNITIVEAVHKYIKDTKRFTS